jgi:hypothetical protein
MYGKKPDQGVYLSKGSREEGRRGGDEGGLGSVLELF